MKMHQGCIEVPVEDKSVNMVAFSQNQEVSADQLIIDRRCDIFADELAIWKILGRRWAISILKNLDTKEAIRFNELKRLMPGISSTVLAERLSELEVEGLISKKIYPEIPPKATRTLHTIKVSKISISIIFLSELFYTKVMVKPKLKVSGFLVN